MKNKLILFWTVLKRTASNFFQGNAFTFAASIAFYTIFSLPAVLLISLAIGATIYEQDLVMEEMMNQITLVMGPSSAREIEKILDNAALDGTSFIAKTVGIITLVFSATTVFMSLQEALNRIWKVKAKPKRGFLKYIINRLLSLAMVISIGFILLVSLVVDTLLVIFQTKLLKALPDFTVILFTGLNILISLSFVSLIFALIFKVLPDVKIKWRDVWIGSLITMVLFTLGKFMIGFYLGNSSVGTAYGAAGSLVVILVWVYYSTVILLFGAEFTHVYSEETEERLEPVDTAVNVEVIEVEKESTAAN